MKTVPNDKDNEYKSKKDVFIVGAFFLVPGVYYVYIILTHGIV